MIVVYACSIGMGACHLAKIMLDRTGELYYHMNRTNVLYE